MFSARTAVIAASALATVSLGGVASAEPPAASLALSLHKADGTVAFTQLQCDPAGGTHPTSAQACAALDETHGQPAALQTSAQACPMIHEPVRASAHGHWHGHPVHFTEVYNNRCLADAESHGVFGF